MSHSTRILAVAIGVGLSVAGLPMAQAADEAPVFRASVAPVAGKYVVVLKDGATKSGMSAQAAGAVKRITQQLTERGAKEAEPKDKLGMVTAELDQAALDAAKKLPNVAYIEEDSQFKTSARPPDTSQVNPTWGLDRLDQVSLPYDRKFTYNYSGKGVNAYIIDTGVNGQHQEFQGRLGQFYDGVQGKVTGFNDCNGHGTHVAGTIGGANYGVAKDTQINGIRVLGCDGIGNLSWIIDGMDWVAKNAKKPAVANMSLGGGYSRAQNDAVDRLVRAGIPVVVASGNSGADACRESPASAASAITVSASNSRDELSSFSNWGKCVDIIAPGQQITSAWKGSSTATIAISGTSMASPHVAGAVAMYLQARPQSTYDQVERFMNIVGVKDKISSTRGTPNVLLSTLFTKKEAGKGKRVIIASEEAALMPEVPAAPTPEETGRPATAAPQEAPANQGWWEFWRSPQWRALLNVLGGK